MQMRKSSVKRKTKETDVVLELNLDGCGKSEISTGSGFFDHMLTLFAAHGRFDLTVACNGDTNVDFHHSAEDIGICLGKAFAKAIGDMKGICRYGSIILPMDEALVLCAADFSGRAHLTFDAQLPAECLGNFDTELVKEFLLAFVRCASITLHIRELSGENTHHIIEAVFKALGRTLRQCVSVDAAAADEIPSTKGVLI